MPGSPHVRFRHHAIGNFNRADKVIVRYDTQKKVFMKAPLMGMIVEERREDERIKEKKEAGIEWSLKSPQLPPPPLPQA